MTLLEFKNQIEKFEFGKMFNYGISDPFSWRGSYDEVAFRITENPMSREELLSKIDFAYNEVFYGYKGGRFEYSNHTTVHFEQDSGSYTDGVYCAKIISKIEEKELYESQEMRLVKIAFC